MRNDVLGEVDSENEFRLFNIFFNRIRCLVLEVIIPQNQGLKRSIIVKSFEDSFAAIIADSVF